MPIAAAALRGRDPVVRRTPRDHGQRVQEHAGDLSPGLARAAQLPFGRRTPGRLRPADGRAYPRRTADQGRRFADPHARAETQAQPEKAAARSGRRRAAACPARSPTNRRRRRSGHPAAEEDRAETGTHSDALEPRPAERADPGPRQAVDQGADGYANYHFNELNRDRVWNAFSAHGAFDGLAGTMDAARNGVGGAEVADRAGRQESHGPLSPARWARSI
jgi:hypothetical protein